MIYFAYSGGRIKIGRSDHPLIRLVGLINSSPLPVTFLFDLEGDKYTESDFHHAFRNDRLHGEWFALSSELRTLIQQYLDTTADGSELLRKAEREFATLIAELLPRGAA